MSLQGNLHAHARGDMSPRGSFAGMDDQMHLLQMTVQRVKESETQLPSVLRQVSLRLVVIVMLLYYMFLTR